MRSIYFTITSSKILLNRIFVNIEQNVCILPKKGCQIITINSHSTATPSIIKTGHQNCNMWLWFCHTWLIFVYLFFILSKAELLQLKLHSFICMKKFINKKIGNRKNQAHFYYISFKSWILGGFRLMRF